MRRPLSIMLVLSRRPGENAPHHGNPKNDRYATGNDAYASAAGRFQSGFMCNGSRGLSNTATAVFASGLAASVVSRRSKYARKAVESRHRG